MRRLRSSGFWLGCGSLLWLFALGACQPAESPAPPPPAQRTATPIASPTPRPTATPSPSPTPDPFVTFVQTLQAALESNDEAALRSLIAPMWYSGRYRAPLTQYNQPAEASAAYRAMQQGARLALDLSLKAPPLDLPQTVGERAIVARWKSSSREEFAYVYADRPRGEWRWSALVLGVPPEVVMAQPAETPTVAAALVTAAGHLVFTRGSQVIVRELPTGRETPVGEANGLSQWDWTRDGTRAVFVRGTGAESEIWTMRRDGSNARALTSDTVAVGSPRWSPDGTQIVYVRNPQTVSGFTVRGEIWLMNADGSNKRKLDDGFDPAWSPEGQRIAFASNAESVRGDVSAWSAYARNGIHLMNAQGRNEWVPLSTEMESPKYTPLEWHLSAARLVDSPVWSPDGREIALRAHGGHGAYVTTRPTNGGFGRFIALFFDDVARGFSYSPDGAYITIATGGLSGWETLGIYRSSTLGRDGVTGAPFRTVGRIPRDAGEVGQQVLGFDWSPDGKQLAYALVTYPNNDQSRAPASSEIWLLTIASGESRLLSADGSAPLRWLP